MASREEVLAIIDNAYAARARGDKAAVDQIWAPGATYQMVGEASLMRAYPVGPGHAETATHAIIDLFTFHDFKRIDAIVEGNRAAILIRVTLSTATHEPRETMLYDLWELDDDGKVKSVIQFTDTALVSSMMHAV